MELWLCVVVNICFWVLCDSKYENVSVPISLSESMVHKDDHILRVLIIGDANDKFAVEDWCKKETSRILLTDKLYIKTLYSTSKKTLVDFVKPYPNRRKSWEIRICESPPAPTALGPTSPAVGSDEWKASTVVVSSVTNKFGTKTTTPYSQPLATLGGLDGRESADFNGKNWTIQDLFDAATAPALHILCKASGGLPDGVLVHSMHQDLSHPPDFKEIDPFLPQWEKGMLELFRAAKMAFPGTPMFTRTGNKFAVFGDSWNNHDNLELLGKMNGKIRSLADRSGYRLLDYAGMVDKDWYLERMRPEFEENVGFIDLLVKSVFWRRKNRVKGRGNGGPKSKRDELVEKLRSARERTRKKYRDREGDKNEETTTV